MPAVIHGPAEPVRVRLLLDTSALLTTVHPRVLQTAGYAFSQSSPRIRIATASAIESVPTIIIHAIDALSAQARPIRVLIHALPPSAGVDGLLGLNFFRGRRLTIDFRVGSIALE